MAHTVLLFACCAFTHASATVQGVVRGADTGFPIANATVEIPVLGRATLTDDAGRYRLELVPAGLFEVQASALGYAPLSRQIEAADTGVVTLDFVLAGQPIQLRPLTVLAERRLEGGAAERALFEREVSPGVVGVSGQELRDVPVLAEPDVLRSLQALPSVTRLNDLTAQLHVQGGAPDQNLYLWDGVRIFAPYHMFGMFGAFNADAVGRVDFFRGHLPARYGGVLSSVVDAAPPAPTGEPFQAKAGLSLLGLRATARGRARDGAAQWLVAVRHTYADVVLDNLFDRDFPYGFYDVQGRGSLRLSAEDEVTVSGFVSRDRFSLFFDGFSGSMDSRWQNAAASARWNREVGSSAFTIVSWVSHYGGSLRVGTAARSPTSRNGVTVGGLSLGLARRGEAVGYRLGLELEGGRVALEGADSPGGYIMGGSRGDYLLAAAYGEFEAWLGPVRLTPGLRVGYEAGAQRSLIEPRLAGRVHLADDLSLTVGAARTQQILSTLRDDRYVLPGAPFWFLHPEDAPASRSDGVSISLEGWRRHAWSAHLTGYARRFEDVLRWRPVGARAFGQLAFDDGSASGVSAMLRHHDGRLTGWVGYGLAHVRLTEAETGQRYDAAWDRRHSVDAALFFHASDRVTLSGRVVYGSGQPFWPPIGEVDGKRFSPVEGTIEKGEDHPVWAREQLRFPDYYRLDGAVRVRFSVAGYELEGYASMLNLRLRRNVLFYRRGAEYDEDNAARRPVLEPEHFLFAFPSVGFDVRF